MPSAAARLGAVAAVLALLAAACGSESDTPPIAGGAPASDVCGEQTMPSLQEGSHLIGDTAPPVPYSSVPPTSGWHKAGAPRRGVITTPPLTGPEFVSALESGDVVVAYDPARVSDDAVTRIEELATTTFRDRLTTTPFDGLPTPITLAGWGVLRRCDDLDEVALSAFVLAWYGAVSVAH